MANCLRTGIFNGVILLIFFWFDRIYLLLIIVGGYIMNKFIENYLKNKKILIIGLIGLITIVNFVFVSYTFMNKKNKFEVLSESVLMLKIYDIYNELIATGSGFVAIDDDILITNYHVIEGAAKIEAVDESDVVYSVNSVIAFDEEQDLAILRFTGNTNMKPLKLADSSKVTKGTKVIAIGSPLGLKNTVSTGIVSSIRGDEMDNVIQITAPISIGSSGGALFTENKKVIGVTFAGMENGENLNLAIPSNVVKQLYDERAEEKEVKEFLFEHNPLEKYKTECTDVSIDDIYNNIGKYNGQKVKISGYISSLGNCGGFVNGRGYIVSSSYLISNNLEYDSTRNDCGNVHFMNLDDDFNKIFNEVLNVGDYITLYGELYDDEIKVGDKVIFSRSRSIDRPQIIEVLR